VIRVRPGGGERALVRESEKRRREGTRIQNHVIKGDAPSATFLEENLEMMLHGRGEQGQWAEKKCTNPFLGKKQRVGN